MNDDTTEIKQRFQLTFTLISILNRLGSYNNVFKTF